jgi:sugar phosphate isomerase/epimerase
MKLGIINSAFSQAGVDTATGIKHIARIGFDCVDIFTEATTLSKKEKLLIARTCDKANLPIVSLPVVATGLVDFNDPVRAFHVERCKKFVDLAAEFGARNILLVLGEYIWQREVIPPAEQWRWAVRSVIMLTKRTWTSRWNSSRFA